MFQRGIWRVPGGLSKSFGSPFGASSGAPGGALGVLQAFPGSHLGDPWGMLVSLRSSLWSPWGNLGGSGGLLNVFGPLQTAFWGLLCVVWGLVRQTKASFDCYLQYFRKVHRIHLHRGDIFPEGFLGGSRMLFGSHLQALGVSSSVLGRLLLLSWRFLAVSQGVLGTCSASVLVVSSCILL